MWSVTHLDETMLSIQPQIPFHLLIRVKPNFMQAKLDRSSIAKSSKAFPYPFRCTSGRTAML
jgi:hypothetical protein